MKVLVISNYYPFSENPFSGIFITQRLSKLRGFGVDYLALAVNPIDDICLKVLKKSLGISTNRDLIESMEVKYQNLFVKRSAMGLFFYKKIVEKNLQGFRITDFDLIHAHGMSAIPAGHIAMSLSSSKNIPYVVTVHGSDINLFMRLRRKDYLTILKNASKVIFVSSALLKKAKSFGYSGTNAVVIPNGYEKNIFKSFDKEQIRKELGVYKEDHKYIGFVGNLVKIKRADKLGEIFQYVGSKLPNTQFIVVGDGPLRSKIEKDTKDLKIIFTGRQPQEMVAKYMSAMDVMILPSRKEGFGAVCIEAQACGTCVIGSNNGGIPEAIGFEEYIVEEGQDFEKRFAQKVIDVLKNGYDRQKIVERVKDYTWDNIVQYEIEIYKEILR